MNRTVKTTLALALATSTALSMAACSSSGGKQTTESAAGGAAKAKTMTVAMVTHAAAGDTFWDLVRKGAEDAAKNDGVKLEYTSDPDGANPGHVFGGDTLFNGGPGATGRSFSSFDTIIESIKAKLLTLPPETVVHTGHGDDTTVGAEAPGIEAAGS